MWKRGPEVDSLLHASKPIFKRVTNPDNPKLYKIITVRSDIFAYLGDSKPDRASLPEPLNDAPRPTPGGKSKSGRSRKKPKKKRRAPLENWGT